MNFFRFLPAAAFAALGLTAATAAAQTVISSVPYTITSSGKYVLGANLITATAAQTAITISAPNVILDLNGFFVSGPGNDTASRQTVISVGNYSNVTIRNGTVANNGFGIFFDFGSNSINHLIEDVNITRCLLVGFSHQGPSSGTIVRRNVISQIGGSTSQDLAPIAVFLGGGIRAERNTITDVIPMPPGTPTGIRASSSDFLIRNTVTNATIGIFGGKYQNNLFISCAVPFTGGFDAGGNN